MTTPQLTIQEKLAETQSWNLSLTAEYKHSWDNPRNPRQLLMVSADGSFTNFIATWQDTGDLLTREELSERLKVTLADVITIFNNVTLYETLVYKAHRFLELEPWEKVTINGA